MISKSYYVTDKALSTGNVRRLDNLTGAWLDKSIPGVGIGLKDVETDPINPSKVFVVGQLSIANNYYGIYVSSDGGDNWTVPGGNYNVGYTDNDSWIEVCVIDSLNIVVCGTMGRVVKSTDGGLTFNLCTQLPQQPTNPSYPTVLTDLPVYSINFINPLVGVVGTRNYVFATNDGGTTWMLLNGGNFATSWLNYLGAAGEECYGIHMSADTMTINVVCIQGIYRSTDGGLTFNRTYQFLTESGLHLTWINDNELWAFGKNGQRLKTTDGGATWFILSAYNLTGPMHFAGHMYSSNDGFFGETSLTSVSYLTQGTSDSALTGYVSDNSLANVTAIWTGIQPEGCRACPEGYTQMEDQSCQKITTQAAIPSETLYTVCNANDLPVFGQFGTKVLDDISTYNWPVYTLGTVVVDSTFPGPGVTIPVTQTIPPTNSIWGNAATGRLNYAGVWTCRPACPPHPEPGDCCLPNQYCPYGEWIGFSACINIQTTKTYYIGIAGDNYVRFKINGVVAFEAGVSSTPVNLNFNYWYILPVTLDAGTNVIYLEGYNVGQFAAFACEIYDFPPAVASNLASITSQAQLDTYTIFSSANKVGNLFNTGEDSGYSCPPGYVLSLCDGAPVCIKTETIEPIVCFWQLTPCCEQFDPVIVDSYYFANDDIGKTVCISNINGREGCYTVSQTFNPVNYTQPIVINSIHDTCAECISSGCRNCQTCYQLEDCADPTNIITVTNNFADYVGDVVILKNCPDKCWIVEEAPTISTCCWDFPMNSGQNRYQVVITIDAISYTSPSKLNSDQILSYLNTLNLGTFTITYPGPNGNGWTRFCVVGSYSYGVMLVDDDSDSFVLYYPECTTTNCYNGEATTVVIERFTTCEECLPPPVQPEPVKLFQRQVAPGYTTKVCSTDYVEKVNCKFADQVYNVMKNLRYGIATCCEDELQKWTIKKEWLTLEEMSDPNPPKPTCYCYTITSNTGVNSFNYIDSSGNCQTVVLTEGQQVRICAMYYPKVVCSTTNLDFTIVRSTTTCTSNTDCSSPACECYILGTGSRGALYSYTSCDGTVYTELPWPQNTLTFCAQVGTVSTINGNYTATGNPCNNDGNCQVT